jgi:hypothetical protein
MMIDAAEPLWAVVKWGSVLRSGGELQLPAIHMCDRIRAEGNKVAHPGF